MPVFVAAAIVAVLGGAGFFWKAAADKAAATQSAKARWAELRPFIVTRLNQPYPIELGAVWSMHGGRICGLVNGKGSFGGLTGMAPFYADGKRPVFGFDEDNTVFNRIWLDCNGDMWIPLVAGATTEGFCGTRAGAARCAAAHVTGS
jgi:hypothetical protein